MELKSEKQIILAIDDDPIILNTIHTALASYYNVIPFNSGKVALKYLEQHAADLILIDLYMPVMSGLEVLKALQSNTKTVNIPVVFLTGSMDAEGESQALTTGAVDYIIKPVRPLALLTRVNIQLELQQHRNRLMELVIQRTQELNEALHKLREREERTYSLLAKVTDMRDSETGNHINRTTEYVRIIAEEIFLNPTGGYVLSEEEAKSIVESAKLHDLGKIAIPDNILLKPGRLSAEEFDVIKTHTIHGEKLLHELSSDDEGDTFLNSAKEIALYHHEKWNGKGYPEGLCNFDIPLSARIVALADVYDALRSERPYKSAFTHQQAVEIIKQDSGEHFDPLVVKIFLEKQDEFEQISESE